MTPLARVVCSPFTHAFAALALVTALIVALLRPQPAIIVVMPAALPAPAATPVINYVPSCYYWNYSWSRYTWPPPCWRD